MVAGDSTSQSVTLVVQDLVSIVALLADTQRGDATTAKKMWTAMKNADNPTIGTFPNETC